jgi:hypothetical protein
MNTLRIGESPTKVKSEDLTRIRGIGLTKQQWLRKLVGIGTIQELANASVNELESQLKNKGHSVSRREVEAWITQAKKLTNQSSESTVEETLGDGEAKEAGGAGEAGGAEEAGEDVGELPITHYPLPITHYPLPNPEFTLEITGIRVFQASNQERPMLVDIKTRKFLGSIRKDESFTLEVSFQVSAIEIVDIANKQITYNIQSQVRNRSTGAITTLGDTTPQTLVQGKNSYTIMLPATTLPLGLYRLRILVMLQGVLAIPGYSEIPLLPVV